MKVILVLLGCLSTFNLLAQLDNTPLGARAVGLGNTVVTLTDHWALFNNVGGLGAVEKAGIFAGYDAPFNFSAFQTFAFGLVKPLKKGVAGLSLTRFGDELYSEQKIALAYALKIENTSIGLKINYLQVHIQDLGSRGNFAFELGGTTQLSKNIRFGAHIYNFSAAKLNSDYEEAIKIPVVMKAGLSYQVIKALLLNIETEKNLNNPARFRLGLEYQLIKKVFLRTGIQTSPSLSHLGLGFHPRQWQFDYALRTHPQLGVSHHISLTYEIGKTKINKSKNIQLND